jgi:uncharacterized phage protein (TIGR01671 family)
LTDLSGKQIFEGDIVQSHKDVRGVVEWHNYAMAFILRFEDNPDDYEYLNNYDVVRVIGNIHDNPELMEGKTK